MELVWGDILKIFGVLAAGSLIAGIVHAAIIQMRWDKDNAAAGHIKNGKTAAHL